MIKDALERNIAYTVAGKETNLAGGSTLPVTTSFIIVILRICAGFLRNVRNFHDITNLAIFLSTLPALAVERASLFSTCFYTLRIIKFIVKEYHVFFETSRCYIFSKHVQLSKNACPQFLGVFVVLCLTCFVSKRKNNRQVNSQLIGSCSKVNTVAHSHTPRSYTSCRHIRTKIGLVTGRIIVSGVNF